MGGWAELPLVGRDDVFEELSARAAAAAVGAGSIVVLTGEAGIGKSSVARTFANQAGTCSRSRSERASQIGPHPRSGPGPP